MMDSMEKLGTNLIQSRVDMRIGQARHAASQDNVDLSKTLLRAVYKVSLVNIYASHITCSGGNSTGNVIYCQRSNRMYEMY